MFGIDFFLVFGIGMLLSAGAMIIYYYSENDLGRAFYKLKQGT